MNVIALSSGMGGTGRTTMVAELGDMLHRMGREVLLIEFDPANVLGLHMGQADDNINGFARNILADKPWFEAAMQTEQGLKYLPFGLLSNDEVTQFVSVIRMQKFWLRDNLQQLALADDAIVLIDVARYPSNFFVQSLNACDRHITLLRPDAGSVMSIDRLFDTCKDADKPNMFLLNQYDTTRVLHLDIHAMLKAKLGRHLMSFSIHNDQAVSEAFASGQSLADYAPNSQATEDIQALANWLMFEV